MSSYYEGQEERRRLRRRAELVKEGIAEPQIATFVDVVFWRYAEPSQYVHDYGAALEGPRFGATWETHLAHRLQSWVPAGWIIPTMIVDV